MSNFFGIKKANKPVGNPRTPARQQGSADHPDMGNAPGKGRPHRDAITAPLEAFVDDRTARRLAREASNPYNVLSRDSEEEESKSPEQDQVAIEERPPPNIEDTPGSIETDYLANVRSVAPPRTGLPPTVSMLGSIHVK